MAFIGNKILLGYDDEQVTDKYLSAVDFKTNKIGGKPNWMNGEKEEKVCSLCGLNLPLIVQIYAPLNNSQYHRTLYVFACINPACWNNDESWLCVRSQKLEIKSPENSQTTKSSETPSSWCTSSDSWGDDSNTNLDYLNEFVENSMTIGPNVNTLNKDFEQLRMEEEREESISSNVSLPVAMIEGAEGDVSIDTPVLPQNDLSALLQQPSSVPHLSERQVEFQSYFIAVDEEDLSRLGYSEEDIILSKLREYRSCQENENDMMIGASGENYEKSLPAHGDKMFHRLVTRINANPGQIIRYGGYPLWLYPPTKNQFKCAYCGGESAFEMQILPTLIPKLSINGSIPGGLEFGSVYIYSCLAGCWDPRLNQHRFEHVVVQREKN